MKFIMVDVIDNTKAMMFFEERFLFFFKRKIKILGRRNLLNHYKGYTRWTWINATKNEYIGNSQLMDTWLYIQGYGLYD